MMETQQTGQGEESQPVPAALPDDFYVTLQPLTLELVAHQLERMSIKFRRDEDRLVAVWSDFRLSIRLFGEGLLSMRVSLSTGYPGAMVTALEARCNWWNRSHAFLKASAGVALERTSPDAEAPRSPIAVVDLDLDLPCRVGIAPVQLQALVSDLLGNVEDFSAKARLDQLAAGW